ncbi:MAG: PAS domain S-box protein [Magnetococcales bacterium]|nr:PAS domain S-box protein [Magnetococcales bacterium]
MNARRIWAGGILLVVVVIMTGLLAYERLGALSGVTERIYRQPFDVANGVMKLRDHVAMMRLALLEALQEGQSVDGALSRIEGLELEIREVLHRLQAFPAAGNELRSLGDASANWTAWCRNVLGVRRDQGVPSALAMLSLDREGAFRRVMETSEALLHLAKGRAAELQGQAGGEIRDLLWAGTGLLCGLLAAGGWIIWGLTRRLRVARNIQDGKHDMLPDRMVLLEGIVQSDTDLAMVVMDETLVVRIFNPLAERLLGQQAAEMVGVRLWELQSRLGVDRQRLEAAIARVRKQGHYQFMHHLPSERGERILELRVAALPDWEKRGAGYLLLARDVTEAHIASQRLARSEEKFRLLMESARDVILVADAETGMILEANRMAEKLLQRPLSEIIGQHQSRFHPPDERGQSHEQFRALAEKGGGFIANVHLVDSRGGRIPVEINAGLLRLGERRVIQEIIRDVTERQHAEQALRWAISSLTASQARLQGILDHARAVITLKNAQGAYLLVNRRFEELFGVRADGFLGQSDFDLFPVDVAERIRINDLRALEVGPFEVEEIWAHGEGLRTWIVVKFPLLDPQGQVAAVGNIATEITDRKRMEDALRQLNVQLEKRVAERTEALDRATRDLQQFAHVASHELQEPLRQVSGFAQLLARRYRSQLDDKADQCLDHMVEGTRHMQEVIEALLGFARVNTQVEPLRLISVERVLDQVLRNLATTLQQAEALVTRDPMPEVRADAFQLVRMFQNLLANAIKFRGTQPPRIHVGVETLEGFWKFSVRDNGIGIEERHRERVFLMFQRLHSNATHPGAGVGLAICQRIAERHGGDIWVESEPGEGSVFFFTLAR